MYQKCIENICNILLKHMTYRNLIGSQWNCNRNAMIFYEILQTI